jgi:uncharacterized membrane protein YfcA
MPELMEWTLLFGAIVGLSLGLTGGGGSIFAVPLLVYGLDMDFRRAVALSLAVVGLTALYGAVMQARQGRVLWGAGIVLGIGGVFSAPLGAWLGERMPEFYSLLLFAALMIFIGLRMLLQKQAVGDVPLHWISCERRPDGMPKFSSKCAAKLVGAGALTGILSGIFGVGGGFLVVPALLVVTCVSIDRALATSLVAIFLISASGFLANASRLAPADVPLGAIFLVGSAIGMTGGIQLKRFIPARGLQIIFGVGVIGTAIFVILQTF